MIKFAWMWVCDRLFYVVVITNLLYKGGTKFSTRKDTLLRGGPFFANLLGDSRFESGAEYVQFRLLLLFYLSFSYNRIFIDKDPKYFEVVLSFLRNGRLRNSELARFDLDDLCAEFHFYGLHPNFSSYQQEEATREQERVLQIKRCEEAQQEMKKDMRELAEKETQIQLRIAEMEAAESRAKQELSALAMTKQGITTKMQEVKAREEELQERQMSWETGIVRRHNIELEWNNKIKKWNEDEKNWATRMDVWKKVKTIAAKVRREQRQIMRRMKMTEKRRKRADRQQLQRNKERKWGVIAKKTHSMIVEMEEENRARQQWKVVVTHLPKEGEMPERQKLHVQEENEMQTDLTQDLNLQSSQVQSCYFCSFDYLLTLNSQDEETGGKHKVIGTNFKVYITLFATQSPIMFSTSSLAC